MSGARFGFAADPRALNDLREVPEQIRDLALLHLQDLVHGEQRGPRLEDRPGAHLADCRKLYVDPSAQWRLVYQERPAPPASGHEREIFLLSVGPRQGHEAYNSAAARLGRQRPAPAATTPLAQAARSRSPRTVTTRTPPAPAMSPLPSVSRVKGPRL